MAMIYQLVTQACEQLVHSTYSVRKHVKKLHLLFLSLILTFKKLRTNARIHKQTIHFLLHILYIKLFVSFRGGVEAGHVH